MCPRASQIVLSREPLFSNCPTGILYPHKENTQHPCHHHRQLPMVRDDLCTAAEQQLFFFLLLWQPNRGNDSTLSREWSEKGMRPKTSSSLLLPPPLWSRHAPSSFSRCKGATNQTTLTGTVHSNTRHKIFRRHFYEQPHRGLVTQDFYLLKAQTVLKEEFSFSSASGREGRVAMLKMIKEILSFLKEKRKIYDDLLIGLDGITTCYALLTGCLCVLMDVLVKITR